MPSESYARGWLLEQLEARAISAFEGMTMEKLAIECRAAADAPSRGFTWRQPFAGAQGVLWFTTAPADVAAIGSYILAAAGLAEAEIDEGTAQSTYLEIVSQIAAGVAQTMSANLGHEVTPQGGAESQEIPNNLHWSRVEVPSARSTAVIHVGYDDAFIEPPAASAQETLAPETAAPITSRTFDLLLDVELPVSVSFGRAQVQLKDVLKLTTGSIVELNRVISEPVEIVVNNCVIARGEVVVVEGNFGVRIQQVMSRQDRLRTLN